MPYCTLETNVAIDGAMADGILKKLSAIVSRVTGKPESIVQASLTGGVPMRMAGSDAPTAHVAVKGIGFSDRLAQPMSKELCALVAEELGIDGKRVFITFDSYSGAMWGADGKTFN